MGVIASEGRKLIQYGKYRAEEKLERISRFWETGDAGLPEEDKIDWHGRETIGNWEGWALPAGRRLLRDYIGRFAKDATLAERSEIGRLIREGDPAVYDLPGILTAALPQRGFGALRSLPGFSAEAVAEAVAVFRAGMLTGLLYTNDDGEIPDTHILERIAGPFPVSRLAGVTTAACFFTHTYFGCQDVIHVHRAGIPEVTLIDVDGPRTDMMKRIYPSHWSYVVADFRDFIKQASATGASYDLVVADTDLSLVSEVINKMLRDFVAITRRVLCLLYTGDALESDGFDIGGVGKLSDTLSTRAGRPVTVLEVMHRNTIASRNVSIFWVVIGC